MKGTETFKNVIQQHLEALAATDDLFAVTYAKTNKNIEDCITYILNTVKDTGNNGFADDEIFNMAIHYYDEDDVKVGQPVTGVRVVSNHHVELSEQEIEEARAKAKEKVFEEERQRLKGKPKTPKIDPKDTRPGEQMSLF